MKLHKSSSSSGVALVIVLGFLVIISALGVAFFSSVSTELKASRNFSAGVTTRQLADSAVQTVMGQIRDATTRPNGCWASQPGMIRVYRTDSQTPSGNADAFLKLYSSDNMVVTKSQLGNFDPATSDVWNGWAGNPAYWTDLNAPVMVPNPANPSGPKIARFPIIDPSAAGLVDGFSFNGSTVGATAISGVTTDDGATQASTAPMPVQWIYVLQDGTLLAPDSASLKTAGTTATFSTTVKPTMANPIVGRIAFWTDDETSKLNLNTAAGYMPNNPPSGYNTSTYAGSFWDTPRFYTTFDMGQPNATGMPTSGGGGLAICQLLQNEFQRYPGHPATTSLNPVFGPMINAAQQIMTSDQLYTVLPRYSTLNMNNVSGSSAGGTARVVVGTSIPNPTPDVLQLQPKPGHLYASVDEFLFAMKSTSASTSSAYRRVTNSSYLQLSTNNTTNTISPVLLDKVRFFLTTQSRAPELNLYGQPRISIWPVRYQTDKEGGSLTTNGLNAFDNTILFCSSVGQTTNTTPPNTETVPPTTLTAAAGVVSIPGSPVLPFRYIFTRREMRSPGVTYTTDQLSTAYSTTLMDINYPRNSQLIRYLQNLTGGASGVSPAYQAIPGFGGNFLTKYGQLNRDSILTEIFDYIRCANAIDTTTMSTSSFTNGTGTSKNGNPAQFAPQGTIMPSRVVVNGAAFSHGMGRFPTVSEASLVFYYAGPQWDTTVTDPTKVGTDFTNPKVLVNSTTAYPTVRRYRAFLLLSTFNPMQGYAPTSNPTQFAPKVGFTVTGLDGFLMTSYGLDAKTPGSIKDQPVFPSSSSAAPYNLTYTATAGKWSTKLHCASGASWGGRNYGGYEGFMHTLLGQYNPQTNAGAVWAPQKIARGNVTNQETTSAATANYLQFPYNAYHILTDSGSNNTNTPNTTFSNAGSQEFYELQSPDPDLYRQSSGGFSPSELMVPVNITEKTTISAKQDISDKYFAISSKVGGGGGAIPVKVQITYGGLLVQTLTLNFPATFPTAGTPQNLWPLPGGDPGILLNKGDTTINPFPAKWETAGFGATLNQYDWGQGTSATDNTTGSGSFYPQWHQSGGAAPTATVLQTHLWAAWSFPSRLAWSMQNSWSALENTSLQPVNYYGNRWRNIVQPGDTIRSVIYCNTPSPVGTTNTGDMRLALLQDTPSDYYPHPEYLSTYSRACLLRMADGEAYFPPGGWPKGGVGIGFSYPSIVTGNAVSNDTTWGNHIPLSGNYPGQSGAAKFPASAAFGNFPYSAKGAMGGVNGVVMANSKPGDFDTGIGSNPDGPFGNKQDEGNVIYAYQDPLTGIWYYPIPYFAGTWEYQAPGNTYTSPCRQMPSPAMFGSLPSQVATNAGWTTLCFCPNPAAGSTGHIGNVTTPKDHLLLDLFQMPVVEPYPISEPFSTAGKVNLNYHIAPFGYITRSTALRGALTPLRVTAVPGTTSNSWNDIYLTYKSGQRNPDGSLNYSQSQALNVTNSQYQWPNPITTNLRTRLDLDQTIAGFETFFAQYSTNTSAGFFKSASQICEMNLCPIGTTSSTNWDQWWSVNGTLTGDNEREKPYVDLYNRLTTKSNTYTVHMRVQTLRQLPRSNGDYTTWTEGKDAILGEYRGSSTIERYIDPADRRFDPNNSVTSTKKDGIDPDIQSVEPLYRFRTVITKKFSP